MNESGPASAPVVIRDSAETDIAAITAIYGHYVRTSLATFEEIPPSETEMAQRRADLIAAGLPFIVANDAQGRTFAFAYAGYYRPRSAYRFTLEDSIYVDAAMTRRGIGRILLMRLIDACAAAGFRQMVSMIGDSANVASIGLHEACGFQKIGVQPAVGFKLGRWVDGVIMQRALGPGSSSAPF